MVPATDIERRKALAVGTALLTTVYPLEEVTGQVRVGSRWLVVRAYSDAAGVLRVSQLNTGELLAQSLPGHYMQLDYKHVNQGRYPMSATSIANAPDTAGIIEPNSRGVILDRAARALQPGGLNKPAPFAFWHVLHSTHYIARFDFWHAGQTTHYIARWAWLQADSAPRVLVFNVYSGHFVCQSLPGQPYDIDREVFRCDVPEDLLERELIQARRGIGKWR